MPALAKAPPPAPVLPGESPPRRRPRNTLNDLSGREWVQSTKSWFVCDGRSADFTDDIVAHPASFPPELAMRFIRFFTKPGAVVLDPFVGCGSTLEAAYRTGRAGLGIELKAAYVESCRRRIAAMRRRFGDQAGSTPLPRVIAGDAARAGSTDLPTVDLVFTSPPYWNMLKQSRGGVASVSKRRAAAGLDTDYGDDPRDLGNRGDYERYLADLTAVFTGLSARLRPGAYIVIVVQNVRTAEGTMRPVAWELGLRLSGVFALRQEAIWCQDRKYLGCWGYPSTYVSNVHHHYCLVLEKPR
jgi:tRNA G10  N-methylase Trm11